MFEALVRMGVVVVFAGASAAHAGAVIPEHWHTSAERMVLVSGDFRVTYQGQEPAVLKSGTYAYGPAKLPHRAMCGNSGPCILFIAFESAVDAVPTAAPRP